MGFWKGLMDMSPASSGTSLPRSSQHGPVKGQSSLQRSLVYAGRAADLCADIPTAAQARDVPSC